MRSSIALLLCACGPGVHDLGLESAPLLTLRGHVDIAAVNARAAGQPLYAALVWADLPNPVIPCLKWPNNAEVQARCPSPFRVVRGPVEVSTLLAPGGDGSFELPLKHLPGGDVSVGDSRGRVAYGSLMVFAGQSIPQSGPFEGPLEIGEVSIVAASFYSMHEAQSRLVFREGAFDGRSNFYPAPGCADPPLGFSVLEYDGLFLAGGVIASPIGACKTQGVSETIELVVLRDDAASDLLCGGLFNGSNTQPAFGPDPPAEFDATRPETFECLDAETLAVFPQGVPCGVWYLVTLRGCFNESATCTNPDWDLRSNPPSWWPC